MTKMRMMKSSLYSTIGLVEHYDEERGLTFIRLHETKQVKLHAADINSGRKFRFPKRGDRILVQFEDEKPVTGRIILDVLPKAKTA